MTDFLQRLFHFSLLADNFCSCNRMIFLSACSVWLRRGHVTWSRTFGEEHGLKVLAHDSVYEITAFCNVQSRTHLPAFRESHTQGNGTVGSSSSAAPVNFQQTARWCVLRTLRETENRVLRSFKISGAADNRRAYKTAERRDSRPVLLSVNIIRTIA
jgi:hypothetical protein